jgi:hypothetical protein
MHGTARGGSSQGVDWMSAQYEEVEVENGPRRLSAAASAPRDNSECQCGFKPLRDGSATGAMAASIGIWVEFISGPPYAVRQRIARDE